MSERYSDAYAATHGRFAVVPAVYVLLRRGDEVLLQLRQGTGYYDAHWAFGAAGHVEAGEAMTAAAVREAAEELGVSVRVEDLDLLTVMHRTDGSGRAIEQRLDVFFQVSSWQGEPRVVEEEKADRIGWFALDALPERVVPHECVVLDALAAGRREQITLFGF
ncbi:NUDIX domain-containing protein [Microbacterium sp. NPDC055903]